MNLEEQFKTAQTGFLGFKSGNDYLMNPLGYMLKLADEQPHVSYFKLGPLWDIYLVTKPDYIRDVLVKHWQKTVKWSRMADASRWVAPYNIGILEGDIWRKHRKLLTPAFHTQRIKAYLELMQSHTLALLNEWNDNQVINISDAMTNTTMGIISEILFDISDVHDSAKELTDALNVLLNKVIVESTSLMVMPNWIPSKRHQEEREAKEIMARYLDGQIQKHRAEGVDKGDVLSALLTAQDADTGELLTDNEIRDELYALWFAGHETTALLTTWALFMMAKHPEIQEQVYQEAKHVIHDNAPSLEDLANLAMTDRVVKETLRHYPPAHSLFLRDVIEDIPLDETTIPKGSVVYISPYVQHHLPQFWDNPTEFDPSRFEGDWKDRIPHYAYMPFGGGAKVCLGAHMAEMEAAIMLSTIIKHYRVEVANPDENVWANPQFTLKPVPEIHLRICKRS